MEAVECDTTTASRDTSPSLPEEGTDNAVHEDKETPMETAHEPSSSTSSEAATTEPSTAPSSSSSCDGATDSPVMEEGPAAEKEEGSECVDSEKGDGVLTEAMLKEEQRLHDAESRESSTEREKVP